MTGRGVPTAFETLASGTHLLVDGFLADAGRLADREAVRSFLAGLADAEADGPETLVLLEAGGGDAGVSGARVGPESYTLLHAFPGQGKLTLDAFSRRGLRADALVDGLRRTFAVGRTERQQRGRSRQVPLDAAELERLLVGDRIYAEMRLTDLLRG